MSAVDATLDERGRRYGSFTGHAQITQAIKKAMIATPKWGQLQDDQREALDMVAHKIGRILNGDPDYIDSWHDIIGYTRLVEQRLEKDEASRDAPVRAAPSVAEQINAKRKQAAEDEKKHEARRLQIVPGNVMASELQNAVPERAQATAGEIVVFTDHENRLIQNGWTYSEIMERRELGRNA